jgi:hypothetical protein
MIGLIFSEVMLFAAAALIGFALGWRIHSMVAAQRRAVEERDIEQLRTALTEVQVRRARGP